MCVGCIELLSKVKAITHFVGYFFMLLVHCNRLWNKQK